MIRRITEEAKPNIVGLVVPIALGIIAFIGLRKLVAREERKRK